MCLQNTRPLTPAKGGGRSRAIKRLRTGVLGSGGSPVQAGAPRGLPVGQPAAGRRGDPARPVLGPPSPSATSLWGALWGLLPGPGMGRSFWKDAGRGGCEGPWAVDPPLIRTPTRRNAHLLLHPPAQGEPSTAHSAGGRAAGLLPAEEAGAEGSGVPAVARAAQASYAPAGGIAASRAHLRDHEQRSVCPAHLDGQAPGLDAREPCPQPSRTPVGPGPSSPRPPAESVGTESLAPPPGPPHPGVKDEEVPVGQGCAPPGPGGAGGGGVAASLPAPRPHQRMLVTSGRRGFWGPDPPNSPSREEEGLRGGPPQAHVGGHGPPRPGSVPGGWE